MRTAALAILIGVVAACGSPAPRADGDWVRYTGQGVVFEHPSGWRPQTFNDAVANQKPPPIVYLSNQELVDPCIEHERGFSCDVTRMVQLMPQGVVLTWYSNAGSDSQLSATRPGGCSSISGDLTVTGVRAGYKLEACSRGRDAAAFEVAVKRVFESLSTTS